MAGLRPSIAESAVSGRDYNELKGYLGIGRRWDKGSGPGEREREREEGLEEC